MAYATGIANNAGEIVAAIKARAVSGGWSESGTTLVKGDIYTQLDVTGSDIFIRSGLGGVGLNQTARSNRIIGGTWSTATGSQLSYPCTYHVFVHSDPDNVVCFVNYNVNWWQWLMFGKALNLGVDGTCNYQAGSFPAGVSLTGANNVVYWSSVSEGVTGTNAPNYYGVPFPLWPNFGANAGESATGDSINLEGTTWLENRQPATLQAVNIRRYAKTFLNLLPNAWNGETTLVRCFVKYIRSTGVYSYGAELPHIRLTRNNNYNDGDTITLGSDEWMIFPGLRKNTASPNASISNPQHSGTIAIAVRKTT